jgi:hypothetical protein
MKSGTFVSADEIERADARALGYANVVGHPVEFGDLAPGGVLVMDIDRIVFGDRDAAIELAKASAKAGVSVGVRTYDPDDPRLDELRVRPNVVIAKTHRHLLAALRDGRRTQPVRATTDTVSDQGKAVGSAREA